MVAVVEIETASSAGILEQRPTDWIEAEVMKLAGHLAAGTCRFLVYVGELDRREANLAWESRTMAHWLAWKCGVGLRAAQEQVRVARALRELPVITEFFARGQLSYSKVRALTRIATPESEAELVEFARHATAAQLDKVVRTYRRIRNNMDPDRAAAQLRQRAVRFDRHDDGTVTLTGRLTPESAARLERALEVAVADVPEPVDEPDSPHGARRADALDAIVTSYLEPDPEHSQPVEMVVHADLTTLVTGEEGRGETENGTQLATETLRRLACDCGLRLSVEQDGKVVDMGRKKRHISPALRRAIEDRDDHRCRFPGCTQRHRLRIHHLEHYADGGETVIVNLVLLCPMHHRAVHEGGWTVAGAANDALVFHSPRGRPVPETPTEPPATDEGALRRENVRAGIAITSETIRSLSNGERMDLDWTMTAICAAAPISPN